MQAKIPGSLSQTQLCEAITESTQIMSQRNLSESRTN